MSEQDVPDRIRSFVFHHIDSVEQLEILLVLSSDKSKSWSVQELTDRFRSNPNSIRQRLQVLKRDNLVREIAGAVSLFEFSPADESIEDLIRELGEVYRLKPHRVLELIFSSMKKARFFADAFRLTPPRDKKGDDDA